MSLICVICGCPETERPLISLRFEGKPSWACPGCMPALIHGMEASEVATRVRQAQKEAS